MRIHSNTIWAYCEFNCHNLWLKVYIICLCWMIHRTIIFIRILKKVHLNFLSRFHQSMNQATSFIISSLFSDNLFSLKKSSNNLSTNLITEKAWFSRESKRDTVKKEWWIVNDWIISLDSAAASKRNTEKIWCAVSDKYLILQLQ